MPPIKIPEGPYTIEGIMRNLEQQFAGNGSETEPRRLTGEANQETAALLSEAQRSKRVAPDYRIRSHRGWLGAIIDPIKRFLHWGTRPYVDLLIENQERHNEDVMRLLGVLRREIERHGQQADDQARLTGDVMQFLTACHQEIEHFERRLTEAEAGNADLQEAIRRLRARHDLGGFFGSLSDRQRLDLMDHFRGSRAEIANRQSSYIQRFRSRPGQILDVGCGRGEFLELLRREGIEGWGCEVDPALVELSRGMGLHVVESEALEVLASADHASLGGVFCAQVVEHMFPGDLLRFLKLANDKLAPGGLLLVETLNPQSLGVLAKSYYKDLDHKQPIDPDYLAELIRLIGFTNVAIERRAPFETPQSLPDVPSAAELGITEPARELLHTLFTRLNETIWGAQDYAISAETPDKPSAAQ